MPRSWESARMLSVLSELCAFTGAGGGCCAQAAQGLANASSMQRTTRALFFRRENEKFRVSMSEHGGFILPVLWSNLKVALTFRPASAPAGRGATNQAALPERFNLLRCAIRRITLPRGFSARGEML